MKNIQPVILEENEEVLDTLNTSYKSKKINANRESPKGDLR